MKRERDRVTRYVYDRAGRLIEESANNQTMRYSYDAHGNRVKRVVTGAEPSTTTYTYYPKTNLLQQTVEVRGKESITTTYTYDKCGNELRRVQVGGVASTITMGYNGLNQLVRITKDGKTTTYRYRPDGLRHSKTVDGAATTHIWDGGSIVAEIAANGNLKGRYIRGTELIAQDLDGALQYYLHNAHGDVVLRTMADGTILKRYDYDAFGEEQQPNPFDVNPASCDPNPFRYCGEYFDKESGDYYLRARYYNPRTGRFGSEDPARDGLNWYTYCGNNPVMYIDPVGLYYIVQDRLIEYDDVKGNYTGTYSIQSENTRMILGAGIVGGIPVAGGVLSESMARTEYSLQGEIIGGPSFRPLLSTSRLESLIMGGFTQFAGSISPSNTPSPSGGDIFTGLSVLGGIVDRNTLYDLDRTVFALFDLQGYAVESNSQGMKLTFSSLEVLQAQVNKVNGVISSNPEIFGTYGNGYGSSQFLSDYTISKMSSKRQDQYFTNQAAKWALRHSRNDYTDTGSLIEERYSSLTTQHQNRMNSYKNML